MRETTALHIASRMGFAKMSEILIDNGADVNAKDISGKTPIYEACYYGDKDTIKLLLDNGAKIASGESAYRILNEPVKNGNTEIVQILLGNSENIFLQEEKIKENLIKIAMDYGYTDIVELLGGDAKQISESKKCGPYSIIVTNPESVTKYLEFRSISFDDIWIPETKLIKEIESSLSVTFPSNNYVGQKATYKDSISNNEIIRNYCKEYSGFIYRDKKYIICNMIEGLEKPFANKFHRLDSYDRDVKCIIIDAKTMEIEKLIDESRLFMPYY